MVAIKTRELTKKYRDLVAVNSVTLEIMEKECFGLLGPNGAGKTTLIRMLTAVSPPTAGDIWVLGDELKTHYHQVKAIIGVIPQVDNLDPDLTVLQNLVTFSRYFDIPGKEARKRAQELLQLFKLEEKHKSAMKELSGGMKRRLLIARGLINRPKIVILDEPTIGLDPQSKYLVWHKLIELKEQGVTQLLCTQNMEEAEALCDRVAIMHQGKILSLDTPKNLIAKYVGHEVWEIEATKDDKDGIIKELGRQGLEFEDTSYKMYVFHITSQNSRDTIIALSREFKRRPSTLEDVFLKLTGRSLAE
jgi:lipooligosaccharide transport system ATP-binding protein